MEGIALILIGTAIFSHSWHLLGLYSDGRTIGVIMAALAVGLAVSLFVFDPQILGEQSSHSARSMAEVPVFKAIIVGVGHLRRSCGRAGDVGPGRQGSRLLRRPPYRGQPRGAPFLRADLGRWRQRRRDGVSGHLRSAALHHWISALLLHGNSVPRSQVCRWMGDAHRVHRHFRRRHGHDYYHHPSVETSDSSWRSLAKSKSQRSDFTGLQRSADGCPASTGADNEYE